MELEPANVDAYFETHLRRAEWQALSEADRRAAQEMAERDVAAELGTAGIDGGDIFQYCAVCEQALFLAHNREADAEACEIASERIEGVGSRGYRDRKERRLWSRRALAFLRRARPGTRFGRG